ncbi:MAG: hypothetical protein PHD02_00885 [Bacilli bacterium]|nr:hypothetical protein [Bacilli bacterium]
MKEEYILKDKAYHDTLEIVKAAVTQPSGGGDTHSLNIWCFGENITDQIQIIYDKLLEIQKDIYK